MKSNIIYQRIDNLPIFGFIAKENLNLDTFSIEPRLSLIRKKLKPKEFKSMCKLLIRTK